MEKSADAFRTISEVADDLTLPQHVLRFWETRFPQIRPLKRAGGRRYYRPADIVLLKTIRQLLYDDGYTIKGVQRLLKEQGPKALTVQEPVVQESIVQEPPDLPTVHGFTELHESMDEAPSYPASVDLDAEGEGELQREALVEAIATIDDCLRILATARRKS